MKNNENTSGSQLRLCARHEIYIVAIEIRLKNDDLYENPLIFGFEKKKELKKNCKCAQYRMYICRASCNNI